MPSAPWDKADLDDFGYIEGRLEGPNDWSDPAADWFPSAFRGEAEEVAYVRRWSSLPHGRPAKADPEDLDLSGEDDKKRFQIVEQLKGQEYTRSQSGWLLNGVPFTFKPIADRLEGQLYQRLAREDREVDDPADLLPRAWIGQAIGHHDRVVDLTSRALRAVVRPPTALSRGAVVPPEWRQEALAAAAMLCSARRQLHESEAALDDTDIFADEKHPPLMTSRAAAMCDVGRWDEARALAVHARNLEGSAQVVLLLHRIERRALEVEQASL